MNVQSCIMSTFISINIALLFRPANPQNHNFDRNMQKRKFFVYLPNTLHFMHFQSVRQQKGNNHNKTNKYRWHFRSKPHQTTSLKSCSLCMWRHIDVQADWKSWTHGRTPNARPSTDTGPEPFYGYSERPPNFSRFLRRTWGYGGPILVNSLTDGQWGHYLNLMPSFWFLCPNKKVAEINVFNTAWNRIVVY